MIRILFSLDCMLDPVQAHDLGLQSPGVTYQFSGWVAAAGSDGSRAWQTNVNVYGAGSKPRRSNAYCRIGMRMAVRQSSPWKADSWRFETTHRTTALTTATRSSGRRASRSEIRPSRGRILAYPKSPSPLRTSSNA